MRYKIIISCKKLGTAKKVYELISKSKIYNSKEIVNLQPIKEVCDECARR
jgi:hypothetical protein